jgi:hypothetical protein
MVQITLTQGLFEELAHLSCRPPFLKVIFYGHKDQKTNITMQIRNLACPPSLLNFLSIFEPREAGRYFVWPMRQLYVPIPALNFYRCSKLRTPFPLSFSGNKRGRWIQDISRRLACTQHLPASFLPIFLNLQLNWKSEGGQEDMGD